MYLTNGRWGNWSGRGKTHTFIPDVAESQSDIDNNAPVYKTPFMSYKEPTESELDTRSLRTISLTKNLVSLLLLYSILQRLLLVKKYFFSRTVFAT